MPGVLGNSRFYISRLPKPLVEMRYDECGRDVSPREDVWYTKQHIDFNCQKIGYYVPKHYYGEGDAAYNCTKAMVETAAMRAGVQLSNLKCFGQCNRGDEALITKEKLQDPCGCTWLLFVNEINSSSLYVQEWIEKAFRKCVMSWPQASIHASSHDIAKCEDPFLVLLDPARVQVMGNNVYPKFSEDYVASYKPL